MTATSLPIVFFLMIFLCMASSLAFLVLLAIWLYRDAKLHGQDPVLWLLLRTHTCRTRRKALRADAPALQPVLLLYHIGTASLATATHKRSS